LHHHQNSDRAIQLRVRPVLVPFEEPREDEIEEGQGGNGPTWAIDVFAENGRMRHPHLHGEQVGSNRPTNLAPLHPAMPKDAQRERNQYSHIVNGSNSCKAVSIKAL